jgi:hypothetical protein
VRDTARGEEEPAGAEADALAPLRDSMPSGELKRLVLSIRATLGIEPLVWLTDVASLPRDDAVDLMRASARTLLRAALPRTHGDHR